MKLAEFKDEQAIEAIGNLIEPIARICADEKVKELQEKKAKIATIVAYICKNHARDARECLAVLDGKTLDEYHCNLITLPMKLMEVLNDEEFMQLFTSAEIENPG